jgi:hypothetical protein
VRGGETGMFSERRRDAEKRALVKTLIRSMKWRIGGVNNNGGNDGVAEKADEDWRRQ